MLWNQILSISFEMEMSRFTATITLKSFMVQKMPHRQTLGSQHKKENVESSNPLFASRVLKPNPFFHPQILDKLSFPAPILALATLSVVSFSTTTSYIAGFWS